MIATNSRPSAVLLCAAFAWISGCGPAEVSSLVDGGDVGADAGESHDGGGESLDGGTEDAGTEDAGSLDSGTLDAGAVDSGVADAGVTDAGVPCKTTITYGNSWIRPANHPSRSPRCLGR